MNGFAQISTTTNNRDEANKIARLLVEQKLAACVQIVGPIKSIYRWEGKVEEAEEWLLIVKSKEALFERVKKLIKENHSYDVPEILLVPITGGSQDYLEWLESNLTK
ncbi:MAG: divalent-cation tolerance protein CutA [Actinomycetota bacterium]|nr:divalent-cation tolerance protein CutA [Actinomycetota bacterium]